MMGANLLDEWLERLEFQCNEAEKATKDCEETNSVMMLTSTAPPSLWRARIVAVRRLQQSDLLALLEDAGCIVEHLQRNIPRGWIVDWEDRINAFLAKLNTKREG